MPSRVSLIAPTLGVALLVMGCTQPARIAPNPSASPDLRVVDQLTKASIEANRVVFGVLVEGNEAGSLAFDTIDDQSSWPSGLSAGERMAFCSEAYEPPESKFLDPAHPDAIQPALAESILQWDRVFKGWLSWQVETRPDCETGLEARLLALGIDVNTGQPRGETATLATWSWEGPDARKEGTTVLFRVGGAKCPTDLDPAAYCTLEMTQETEEYELPEGKLVLRASTWLGAPRCQVLAAIFRWNQVRPMMPEPQIRLVIETVPIPGPDQLILQFDQSASVELDGTPGSGPFRA